jgi:hypothetical protein
VIPVQQEIQELLVRQEILEKQVLLEILVPQVPLEPPALPAIQVIQE